MLKITQPDELIQDHSHNEENKLQQPCQTQEHNRTSKEKNESTKHNNNNCKEDRKYKMALK